jgi:glycosyltransferase involved in cell wall biosynthesis
VTIMPTIPDALAGLRRNGSGAPIVLLFYDGYERRAREGLLGGARSEARRLARYVYRSLRRRQVHTGFYTAFLSLARSLREAGCEVRINDFAQARQWPGYPIGLAGYPSAIKAVDLPNPTLFGHGDLGDPESTRRAADCMGIVIQPCQWAVDYNRPYCGEKLRIWPVGIDFDAIPVATQDEKVTDVLVYDKIRWHRDERVPHVIDRITSGLEARGRSFTVLRYGAHIRSDYYRELQRCRTMIFVCEHETQGLAYQEALAAGVPVLAWDEGGLVDPVLRRHADPDLRVTSVPYFDERCGARFRIAGFEDAFDDFWTRRSGFDPRAYVVGRLSMERAARDYLALYGSLART